MSGLEARDIRKTFPTRAGELVVLDGCDVELAPGASLAIVGPSGSGKSTLLYILGTLDRPTSGTLRIDDADPFALDDRELARFRNGSLGFVFQDHHLLPQLSVIENILMPALASSDAARDREDGEPVEERARRLLERVGLGERLDHLPSEISGGERQRVAIARALVLRPKLVLCDEPTGNLDRGTASTIGDLLLEVQREEGTMLIAVTHSLELADRFERRVELDQGRLREED